MILVLADDITGAAEIAGVCLNHGVSVDFYVNKIHPSDKDVVVVCTDSRSMSESDAVSLYSQLISDTSNLGITLFKKCDSILRGWVLSELVPFIEQFQLKHIVLQPANPIAGRTIMNGQYYIQNQLLSETAFKDDPEFPADSSNVDLLLKIRNRLFSERYELYLNSSSVSGPGVYIADATNESDLVEAAQIVADLRVGSAAFFEQILIQEIRKFSVKVDKVHNQGPYLYDNTLIVGGSFHPQTRLLPDLLKVAPENSHYLPANLLTEFIQDSRIIDFSKEILKPSEGGDVFLGISKNKVVFENSSQILSERLIKLVSVLLKEKQFETIFISGGATAWEFVVQMNITHFVPVSQIHSGVVCFYLPELKCNLVLKPGSYLLNFN